MMPKISVIIPAYNQGQYLEDCIESAYNQTVPAHEIIIVDDGSTDNTLEIATRYQFAKFPGIESNVHVIHQSNRGLSSARNTAIMASSGDYILPLDSDDVLHQNAIEVFTNSVLKNPNADVIAPSFECFGLNNERVVLGGFTIEDLKKQNRLGYFSLIKKKALLECGGYSVKMTWGYEDYALWFDLFRRGKTFLVLQDVLVKYRVKDHSMIHTAQAHHEELMAQIRKDYPQIFN